MLIVSILTVTSFAFHPWYDDFSDKAHEIPLVAHKLGNTDALVKEGYSSESLHTHTHVTRVKLKEFEA